MSIRGFSVMEENEENSKISLNIRCLVLKLQNDVNELVEMLIKNDSEDQIQYGLNYFLKKFLDENYSLRSGYDFRIDKCTTESNDTFYEVVVEERI
jgi:hypothetical protein